jgi:hypothetical protein
MFEALVSFSLRIIGVAHADRTPAPLDDGACPICDHPFGLSNHMCVGGPTRIAA